MGMSVSMDGLRRNLSSDLARLKATVQDIVLGEFYDQKVLVEEVDKVISSVNLLNCCFIDSEPDFNEISDQCLQFLSQELENESE